MQIDSNASSDSVVMSCMVQAFLGTAPAPRTDLGRCTGFHVCFEGRDDDEEDQDETLSSH